MASSALVHRPVKPLRESLSTSLRVLFLSAQAELTLWPKRLTR
jgi:hypothetical protein